MSKDIASDDEDENPFDPKAGRKGLAINVKNLEW